VGQIEFGQCRFNFALQFLDFFAVMLPNPQLEAEHVADAGAVGSEALAETDVANVQEAFRVTHARRRIGGMTADLPARFERVGEAVTFGW
jgi:hypothetical protein